QHVLDDQEARARGHGGRDGPQDPDAVVVGPVVEDVGEQVGVRPAGDALEEAAAADLGPVGEPGPAEGPLGAGGDVGQVVDHAVQVGVGLEQGDGQAARAAADVDDG